MKGLLVRDLRVLKNQIKGLGIGCAVIVIVQLFSKESISVPASDQILATDQIAVFRMFFKPTGSIGTGRNCLESALV